jgi:hypothetical protein
MYAVVIILLIVSLACFIAGAVLGHSPSATWARPNFVAAGLACWVLVTLLTALRLV